VTLSGGRELHSWPGATRFDNRRVDDLVGDGPVATGAFGAYLGSVFNRPEVAFHFNGQRTVNGKTVFEYRYRAPLEGSRFDVKVNSAWLPAGYEGEFQIDPESLELERLTIRTTQLPPGATFCQAAATLDYQPVHIGDRDVLLPTRSQMEFVLDNGRQTRNTTSFTKCREYQAESEITFDAPPDISSTAARSGGRGRIALPIGLPVTLALAEPIDTATAAAGDPIAARVVKPVRRPGSTEDLIPAGAMVYGRLRRVEHHVQSPAYFLVMIAYNRVDVQGAVSPFVARSDAGAEQAKELGANLEMRDTGIRFWGVGTFVFPTGKPEIVIPAGFQSKWFTLATGGR
jgi:hypothetical protein